MALTRFPTFLLLVTALAFAQTPPAGGPAGGGAPTTGTNRPSTTTPTPTMNIPTERQEMSRPMFLSGKVQLMDGSVPEDRVAIQRVCGGNPHTETFTDSKGHFSFQVGQNRNNFFNDASETGSFNSMGRSSGRNLGSGTNDPTGGVTESSLMNCELRAYLPGYRSDAIMLAGRKFMDNSDVGLIILRPIANVEGFTTSATSSLAPKDAKKALDKARDFAKKNKAEDSQRELEKAVEIYPRYATAWFELGRNREAQQKPEEAAAAYRKALDADGKYISPYEGLYRLAARQNKWQDVADLSEKVFKMNPYDYPGAYYMNAVANLNLRNMDQAERSIRDSIKLDPQNRNPRNNYVLGLIMAQKQDYEKALPLLKGYLSQLESSASLQANLNAGKEAEVVKKQLADIEKFASAKAAPVQQ